MAAAREEPDSLNRFRHLFCCNGMMHWIGCGTEAVRAPGGLRTKRELQENPGFEQLPDSYYSPELAKSHGAKLQGASFGKINVKAWANATCTTIRGATDYVTLIPEAKEPMTIDNGGTWEDVAPDHDCPCDPATGRIGGDAPTRAEMVKSWQQQTAASVGSENVIWHELLLALRTGLPHSTEVVGAGEQGERTFDVKPGTLPAALRNEMHNRKDHKRGPLESYYTGNVLFPLLQIAAEGIVPPAPLPNVEMPSNIWLTIASGGAWAAVTQQHLAVTRPDNFWLWIVFNDRAIGETPEFTRTVIQHELEHAADYWKDLKDFEVTNPRPASTPPHEFMVPAEEDAVANFGGEWGKYINDFIAYRKKTEKPERHMEIILHQRTQKLADGSASWDRWSAGERAYWFQLVMNNLPADVGKDAVLPGEDQVLAAYRSASGALKLAAVERAYTAIKRALCPPKEVHPPAEESLRANARTLIQHFDPIMKDLFANYFDNTTRSEVLALLRKPAGSNRDLVCNL
jgi:hypothetical protein